MRAEQMTLPSTDRWTATARRHADGLMVPTP
jgi:hypothetical protein